MKNLEASSLTGNLLQLQSLEERGTLIEVWISEFLTRLCYVFLCFISFVTIAGLVFLFFKYLVRRYFHGNNFLANDEGDLIEFKVSKRDQRYLLQFLSMILMSYSCFGIILTVPYQELCAKVVLFNPVILTLRSYLISPEQ